MASTLLQTISQDERERAIFRSRKKFSMDIASDMATAKDIGIQEGIAIMVRKLKEDGEMSIEAIARLSGLSIAEIEDL